jgi:UDP-glucose 4-epimerase
MKCLVLGGCGFIGSHVCDALRQKGHDVFVYDAWIDPNCKYPKSYFSLDNSEWLDTLIADSERVYNFAGILGTASSFDYVSETIEVNVNFAVDVMEECLRSDATLISVGVPPAMWLNPYAITKSCMLEFSKMFYGRGLKGVTLIPYNIYGERQVFTKTEKLIPATIHRILNNEPIKIYGQGKQQIDLLYVKDFAKYVASIDHFGADTIHVGTGEAITVLEVVNAICSKMGVEEPNIEWLGIRDGEAEEVYVVAPSSIGNEIILTDLTLGLDYTIDWYREFVEHYKGKDVFNNRVSVIEPWDKERWEQIVTPWVQ